MRAKRGSPKPATRTRRNVATFGTADWVLVNQGGWGPFGSLAILAGIIAGLRAVAWQVGRITSALTRSPRGRRD